MSKIITGDDTTAVVTCFSIDGTVADLSTASEVKAVLVAPDRSSALTPVYICTSGYSLANWALGEVAVPVLGSDTASLANRKGMWEVQAIIGARKITFLGDDVTLIVRGLIP